MIKMKRKNIAIIGAGPAGLSAAILLSKKKQLSAALNSSGKAFDSLGAINVYEEHKDIGLPVQCTGIITKKAMQYKVIKEAIRESLISKTKNAEIAYLGYSEKGMSGNTAKQNKLCKKFGFELKQRDFVIDRHIFDKSLSETAASLGVKIITKRIRKVRELKEDIVIGADGPLSTVRKEATAFYGNFQKISYYVGVQARIKSKSLEDGKYYAFFGDVAPGFFAWAVPEDNNIFRIGLAAKDMPMQKFREFLRFFGLEKRNAKEINAGLIPCYNPKLRLSYSIGRKKLFLIGDAATQLKATTGGGIVPAIRASYALSKAIALNKSYEKELRKLKLELSVNLAIKTALDGFSEADYRKLFSLLSEKKAKGFLEVGSRDSILVLGLKLAALCPVLSSKLALLGIKGFLRKKRINREAE